MYEQLEVTVSDLESKNKKLVDENQTLENRCEQFRKLLEYYRTISDY